MKTLSTPAMLSRRAMLKGGLAVASGVSFATMFGYGRLFAQTEDAPEGDDVATILNLAATAETLAVTHYHAALTASTIDFTEEEIAYLQAALESEIVHLEFLNANGGAALVSEFYVPETVFEDRAVFASTTEAAETAFIGAYLAATRRAAELGNPLLAATTAQVAGVEAQHLALVREIGNMLPNNIALLRPVYYNVSDAVPTLQPFLEGADGFAGPFPFPGIDVAREAVGEIELEPVLPFTDPAASNQG